MKWIGVLLMLMSFQAWTQSIEEDSSLRAVQEQLPEGWSASIDNQVLTIEYESKVWVVSITSDETTALQSDSTWLCENGKRKKAYLEYSLRPGLSAEQLAKIRAKKVGKFAQNQVNMSHSEHYKVFQKERPFFLQVNESPYHAIWPLNIEEDVHTIDQLIQHECSIE